MTRVGVICAAISSTFFGMGSAAQDYQARIITVGPNLYEVRGRADHADIVDNQAMKLASDFCGKKREIPLIEGGMSDVIRYTVTWSCASPAAEMEAIGGRQQEQRMFGTVAPVLSHGHLSARLYYESTCTPENGAARLFPRLNLRSPELGNSWLDSIRSIFREEPGVNASQGKDGIVRIKIGSYPGEILNTKISRLKFRHVARFDETLALAAIMRAPELQAEMKRLNMHVAANEKPVPTGKGGSAGPHLPAEIKGVTLDQALDLVATTWKSMVAYGVCQNSGEFYIYKIS